MLRAPSRSPSRRRSPARPSIRTTPGPPATAAGVCPRCCCRAITPGSASGVSSRAGVALLRARSRSSRLLSDARAGPDGATRFLTPATPSRTMSTIIESIEQRQLKKVPRFDAGDRVRVHFQVIEGTRRRTQVFEGVVIARQGSGARETFTVRKQSFGVGVERIFPLHSPKIERLEVVARGDVRRAKLYYLRGRVGKRARVAERR